ncbi:methyl-accepting chemotaxis protein [Roseateles sp. BYS96W]|uniref:Methyl-accepting chemotaxis protein n=1 Tax=Pelomonas nitida TaxID=3299027 RepID=A0ABW7GCR1_9BURK
MRMTIRHRLLALSGIGLAFFVVVAIVGYLALDQMSATAARVAGANGALRAQVEADMMHDALRADALGAMYHGQRRNSAAMAELRKDLAEHTQALEQHIDFLGRQSLPPAILADVKAARAELQGYITSTANVVTLSDTDPPAAEQQMAAFNAAFKALETAMEKLSDAIENHAAEEDEAGQAVALRARWWLVAAAAAGAALLLVIALVTVRHITVPLNRAVRHANHVAAGDLTQDIRHDYRDETGELLQALGQMAEHLAHLVGEVRQNAQLVATDSGEIASGSLQLSQRTEAQASQLEESAATLQRLTGMLEQSASNTDRASELARQASEVAQEGGQAVSETVRTMAEIATSSSRIADIITLIDGIAFQTNILALNAAVEAARAGEQGRGFAVVASEVRSLAKRSADAAHEIKALIDSSVARVQEGTATVGRAGDTVQRTVAEFGKVAALIHDVNTANREQAASLAAVRAAVLQLDQTTHQNAALAEQSAAAAQTLRDHAKRLLDLVARFKLRG